MFAVYINICIYREKYIISVQSFPHGSVVKNLPANAGDTSLIPQLERSPGVGNGNPPVFLPGKFHGERSLVGYSPWGCKESVSIIEPYTHIHTH